MESFGSRKPERQLLEYTYFRICLLTLFSVKGEHVLKVCAFQMVGVQIPAPLKKGIGTKMALPWSHLARAVLENGAAWEGGAVFFNNHV